MKCAEKAFEIPNEKHYVILVEDQHSTESSDGYGSYYYYNYFKYYYTFDENVWKEEIVKRTLNYAGWQPKFKAIIVNPASIDIKVDVKGTK